MCILLNNYIVGIWEKLFCKSYVSPSKGFIVIYFLIKPDLHVWSLFSRILMSNLSKNNNNVYASEIDPLEL